MEMETSTSSSNQEEEDFIEMELSTSSPSRSSHSNKSGDFEFKMSSVPQVKESATPCPADELFYKGKLLPLHLHPRLQMVQKLLLQANFDAMKQAIDGEEQCSRAPFITSSFTAPPTNSSTPFESCSISPAESCRASCELNPDEHFFQWSTDVSGFIGNHIPKNSWSKKFRLVRHSTLLQRLRASRTYLKSLFMKPPSSDESSANAKAAQVEELGNVSRAKDYIFTKYMMKVGRKIPFGNFDKQVVDEDSFVSPRRSFSGAIKRQCGTKCSSSSSSSSSSNSSSFSTRSSGSYYELNFLKRSSSANPELENSIEGAIAHCKKSQKEQQHNCSSSMKVTQNLCLA